MKVKTFIFTSKQIFNEHAEIYHNKILDSIKSIMRGKDIESDVRCATIIKEDVVLIFGEIIADSSIDASGVVRGALNKLFQNASLFLCSASLQNTIGNVNTI